MQEKKKSECQGVKNPCNSLLTRFPAALIIIDIRQDLLVKAGISVDKTSKDGFTTKILCTICMKELADVIADIHYNVMMQVKAGKITKDDVK
jgi:hypothetical protein